MGVIIFSFPLRSLFRFPFFVTIADNCIIIISITINIISNIIIIITIIIIVINYRVIRIIYKKLFFNIFD